MFRPIKLAFVLAASLAVAGCAGGGTFKTDYVPLDPAQTAGWRVAAVNVTVPDSLTTTEDPSYIPRADIVWHGDPPGDRKAQVAQIMKEGLTAGGKAVNGRTPVVLNATLVKFHATTRAARYNPYGYGAVDDLRYQIVVTDTAGNPLTEPQLVYGDFPAKVRTEADVEDARGNTERVQYVNHIKAITAHWLTSREPDPRMTFTSAGE